MLPCALAGAPPHLSYARASLLSYGFFLTQNYSQEQLLINMSEKEKVEKAMLDFIRGGDNRDVELLDNVLHHDFRVTNNGFMGKPGVTIIDKQRYLQNIKDGIFGGLPRQVSIEHVDFTKTIAMVKVRLESKENSFVSYNSFVLDTNNQWRLIINLAVVEAK